MRLETILETRNQMTRPQSSSQRVRRKQGEMGREKRGGHKISLSPQPLAFLIPIRPFAPLNLELMNTSVLSETQT